MRIWLVRHGITEWNLTRRSQGREDIPLNEGGLKQAEYLASQISVLPITAVVASPLQRAMTTAEYVTRARGYGEVIAMEEFIERDFGLLSGKTPEEVDVLHREEEAGRIDLHVELRESVFERARAGFAKLEAEYGDGNVLVVTHGGVISAILRLSLSDWVPGTFLDNIYLTELLYEDGVCSVTAFNVSPEDFVRRWREKCE